MPNSLYLAVSPPAAPCAASIINSFSAFNSDSTDHRAALDIEGGAA